MFLLPSFLYAVNAVIRAALQRRAARRVGRCARCCARQRLWWRRAPPAQRYGGAVQRREKGNQQPAVCAAGWQVRASGSARRSAKV